MSGTVYSKCWLMFKFKLPENKYSSFTRDHGSGTKLCTLMIAPCIAVVFYLFYCDVRVLLKLLQFINIISFFSLEFASAIFNVPWVFFFSRKIIIKQAMAHNTLHCYILNESETRYSASLAASLLW